MYNSLLCIYDEQQTNMLGHGISSPVSAQGNCLYVVYWYILEQRMADGRVVICALAQ